MSPEKQLSRREPGGGSISLGTQTAPDGLVFPSSWRAYACLFGGFLLMFNSWGIVNAYGTYLTFYNERLLEGHGILQLNLIGATQCFLILLFGFVVGRLLDADHSRIVMSVGVCFVTVGLFMLSVVNGDGTEGQGNYILTWLCQGVISGLGMSCFFVTSSQVVATWFHGRAKQFVLAFVASGAAISGLCFPFMLRFIIMAHGFNFANQMVATLALMTMVIANLLVSPCPTWTPRKPAKWLALETWVDKGAFRSSMFCWLTAGNCLMFFGFYSVFFNLEEWAVKIGVGTKTSPQPGQNVLRTYYLLAIMNGASVCGRIGSAFACMHFNALRVHCTVSFIASMFCFFLWSFASTLPVAISFVVVFGIFSGSVIGLPPASMSAILFGDSSRLGQWTGMMYSISAPFALTGPLIAGHLISQYGYRYITIQCWSGSCLFLSCLCQGVVIYKHKQCTGMQHEQSAKQDPTDSGSATPMSMNI